MINIEANVDKFMEDYSDDKHSRYRSYDYCHKLFLEKRNNLDEQTKDYLALNLYTFLASWGMVCRKGILMKKDYKYLYKAVEAVCADKYSDLIDIDVFVPDFDENCYIDKILELKKELDKAIFSGTDYKYKDTVIGKIMLVTLGCIHAYDSHIVEKLRYLKYNATMSKEGLKDILKFANENKKALQAVQAKYSGKTMVTYSPMKYIDTALWVK